MFLPESYDISIGWCKTALLEGGPSAVGAPAAVHGDGVSGGMRGLAY